MDTLVLVFADNEDNSITFEFVYTDPDVSTSSVNNLVNVIINNGSIFEVIPTRCESAIINLSNGNTRILI